VTPEANILIADSPVQFMELSIIIVNWNTRELLAQCLASIYAHPPSCDFEIWVVDNASSDGSAQMVRVRFPNARLIENCENVGFARANNQAIQESTGRYVLLLNSDTLVCGNALMVLVEFMQRHPNFGIAGAKLMNPDGSFQSSYASFPTWFSELVNVAGLSRWVDGSHIRSSKPADSTQPHSVDWVSGACLLALRKAIEEVGLLDEEYFMYGEEMDWCYRMKQRGWRVSHLPEAQVIHLVGQSSKLVGREKLVWLARSHLRFMIKYHGMVLGQAFARVWFVASVAKTILWFGIGFAMHRTRVSAWERSALHSSATLNRGLTKNNIRDCEFKFRYGL